MRPDVVGTVALANGFGFRLSGPAAIHALGHPAMGHAKARARSRGGFAPGPKVTQLAFLACGETMSRTHMPAGSCPGTAQTM